MNLPIAHDCWSTFKRHIMFGDRVANSPNFAYISGIKIDGASTNLLNQLVLIDGRLFSSRDGI